jgi:S1-C subfamily serine protease
MVTAAQSPGQNPSQTAGGVPAGVQQFRLVRSVSGSRGEQKGGRFVIEDPRSVFYVPEDAKVIVYFEWDGPAGKHHLEGIWKNPAGKVAVLSDFDYEAKEKRFAAFWSLPLVESMPTGVWTIETRVDGEAAGAHSFQVVAAPRPADTAAIRPALTPADIYRKASAGSVFVQKLGARGEVTGGGSGFFISRNVVVTAFQVIDGASNLRVVLADGRRIDTNEVLAWNRRQDWALLNVPAGETPVLSRSKPNSWGVGDRCYAMDSPGVGSRTIVEATIAGISQPEGAGERILLSTGISGTAVGSPLLNEYGDVIGVLGGRMVPGFDPLEAQGLTMEQAFSTGGGLGSVGMATPIHVVSEKSEEGKTTRLSEMSSSEQFVSPVTARDSVLYGVLARGIERKGRVPQPVEQKYNFSRRDPTFAVFVSWKPIAARQGKKKTRTFVVARVFDIDNRLRIETKPTKLELNLQAVSYFMADLPLSTLPAGLYRIDVMLSDETAWRAFFRVSD